MRRGYSRPAVSLHSEFVSEQRALDALAAAGITYEIVRHGPVRSLAEAAAARGVEPAAVVKTIVVRRGEDDFLFVLVPEILNQFGVPLHVQMFHRSQDVEISNFLRRAETSEEIR